MLMNNVVNEASKGGRAAHWKREDGAMRHRNSMADLLLTVSVRATFCLLVIWGFMLYARYEWMMF